MAKRYARLNWQNSPSTATPRSAENLNIMDKGIDDLDNAIEVQAGQITALNDNLATQAALIINSTYVITNEYVSNCIIRASNIRILNVYLTVSADIPASTSFVLLNVNDALDTTNGAFLSIPAFNLSTGTMIGVTMSSTGIYCDNVIPLGTVLAFNVVYKKA